MRWVDFHAATLETLSQYPCLCVSDWLPWKPYDNTHVSVFQIDNTRVCVFQIDNTRVCVFQIDNTRVCVFQIDYPDVQVIKPGARGGPSSNMSLDRLPGYDTDDVRMRRMNSDTSGFSEQVPDCCLMN